ncbi:MAG: hypothetical protein JZU72_00130 [Chlorobium phaeobacteroides]|jgi:hypothetical protein|nr:hypothetical protein [Chlorobium phaeobacteroides]
MDTSSYTLQDFFGRGNIAGTRLEELQADESISELKTRFHEESGKGEWTPVWKSIIEHVDELLGIRLSDIMVRAWKKFEDLSKYRDVERYPPDQLFIAPLMEHCIRSKHQPKIEIEGGRLFKKTIPFDISLQFVLKGFTLEIQDGKIRKIHTGECSGSGMVQCMKVTLLEKESCNIPLPGSIDLGEGIPIEAM